MTTTTLSPVTEQERTIGRWAFFASLAALIVGQLAALARHRTEDGKSDLDLRLTRMWAEPAGDLLAPVLDWADPDFVYFTYNKGWLPIAILFTLVAVIAYRHRRPEGFEKWVWRITVFGYALVCAAAFLAFWTQWGKEPNFLFDPAFILSIPAFLITLAGSTILGLTLLAKRFVPRSTAAILVVALPGLFLIPMVTELGNVLLVPAVAFGLYGRRLALS